MPTLYKTARKAELPLVLGDRMDRKKDRGEHEKHRMEWRDLRKELKELAQMSMEYWDGFRIERKYETRVYVDKDGIRLFQSSTIEADSPPPLGSPFCPSTIMLIYVYAHMYIVVRWSR